MRFKTLDSWLNWQQSLNPKAIDLSLDRVKRVYSRLNIDKIADKVITVAGTNGKGSTVACYETWLYHSGFKVASYTSPYLLSYNEQIKIDCKSVSDAELFDAFEVVAEAREDVPLTFFEYTTLTALYLIAKYNPDFAILEVGMGGRLDAVNIIDADVVHFTPIGLDHMSFLGDTRELIGYQKAGVLREHSLVVCNDNNPPQSVIHSIEELTCSAKKSGVNYHYEWINENQIEWENEHKKLLLTPGLAGFHQAHNLSGVVAGLDLLGLLDGKTNIEVDNLFEKVNCPGRLQKIQSELGFQLLVDVGHNEIAASVIADYLQKVKSNRRIIVLLGMLEDKDPLAFASKLQAIVDEWWLLSIDDDRGLSGNELARRLDGLTGITKQFSSAKQAMAYATGLGKSAEHCQDILLVTGSFKTVESVLRAQPRLSEAL